MSDWVTLPLAEMVTFEKGRKVTVSPEQREGWLPYLGAGALEGRHTEFADPSHGVVADHQDVLMLWDGERSGLVGRGRVGVVASTVVRVTARSGEPSFLYHQLRRQFSWIQARRTGTGVPHVPSNLGSWLRITLPTDASEQRLIARILDTLDAQIRGTEELIAKLEQIRNGLLTDLLTRGIDENGHLRPSPGQAPHLYKESPLGLIPREWDVVSMSRALREPLRNGLYKSKSSHGRGTPMIQMRGLFRGDSVSLHGSSLVEVTSSEFSTYRLEPGDLLIARRSLVFEGAGKSAIVRGELGDATFESSIIRARLDAAEADPEFVALFLGSSAAVRDRRQFIRQVAVAGVSLSDVKEFLVCVPPLDEQREIVNRVNAVRDRINAESKELAKLEHEKSALMDDLLTGRVRVTTLLDETERAAG